MTHKLCNLDSHTLSASSNLYSMQTSEETLIRITAGFPNKAPLVFVNINGG